MYNLHYYTGRVEVDYQPPPVTGLQGLHAADRILKKHEAVGLLIGGMAWELLNTDANTIITPSRKDVDVLVISSYSGRWPGRYEGGIDWWVRKVAGKPFNNGSWLELVWNITMQQVRASPGLHLCPTDIFLKSLEVESRISPEFQARTLPNSVTYAKIAHRALELQVFQRSLLVVHDWWTIRNHLCRSVRPHSACLLRLALTYYLQIVRTRRRFVSVRSTPSVRNFVSGRERSGIRGNRDELVE